jgi:hypothetical protein
MEVNGQSSKALACVMSGLASGEELSMSSIKLIIGELYLGNFGIR